MSKPNGLDGASIDSATIEYRTMEAYPCRHPIRSSVSSSFFVYTTKAGSLWSLYEYTGRVLDGAAPLASLGVFVKVFEVLRR